MAKKAAKTGSGPTSVVAIEQNFPEGTRLINDDMACRILPFGMRIYVWLTRASWVREWMIGMSEKMTPGAWAIFPCRKRYIDDKVAEAAAEEASTVVNLGAGFDTLAFRLPALDTVQVWEVDQPKNIDAKRSRLKKILGEIPTRLSLVLA
jgi:methyltransferase (TIGR00027 family)